MLRYIFNKIFVCHILYNVPNILIMDVIVHAREKRERERPRPSKAMIK